MDPASGRLSPAPGACRWRSVKKRWASVFDHVTRFKPSLSQFKPELLPGIDAPVDSNHLPPGPESEFLYVPRLGWLSAGGPIPRRSKDPDALRGQGPHPP